MRLQPFLTMSLAVLLAGSAHSLFPQSAPAAEHASLPLQVGVGISDYNLDYGQGRTMLGGTLWIDWDFWNVSRLPPFLRGFGIEAEGRDINWDRPASLTRMRQETVQLGANYTVRRYRNFRLYAKYLGGVGGIDFPPFRGNPAYNYDSRTVLTPGGGIEYRAYRTLWVRGDYEYQFWRHIFGQNDLTPHGFTVGVSYDFSGMH